MSYSLLIFTSSLVIMFISLFFIYLFFIYLFIVFFAIIVQSLFLVSTNIFQQPGVFSISAFKLFRLLISFLMSDMTNSFSLVVAGALVRIKSMLLSRSL